ncbi:LysR family transcriptional regulator [Pokkaliibacter plantistimulans]|uniref:LysR family transcriptional regulator n=2 Tax=Pseudomonadota TaxID=1224 RepID=A0A2S5KUZ7_9PROT|nr:LysR family transcriptional regulator [Pokkaliibacter plantistimulans]
MLSSHLLNVLCNRLRYKHLVMLVTLGNSLNMHRASEALNVSQPAATRMLQEIEAAFDCELFERFNRGMRPTAIGLEIIRFAQTALNGLERCSEDIVRFQKGGFGHLTIGTIMGAAPSLVIETIAEIKRLRPRLHITISGDTSDQLIEQLELGKIDVAIGRRSLLGSRSHFSFEPLSNEKLIAVVHSAHPLLQQPELDIADVVNHWPWILQPVSSPARYAIEQYLRRLDLPTPTDVTECSSVFAMLQLIQITDAVMILSESVLVDYLRMGLIRELPIAVDAHLEPFGILMRDDEPLSRELDIFLSLLRQRARPPQP